MATAIFRLALAQLNPTVGDIEGNLDLARAAIDRARQAGAQLVVLPELCLSGYPPEDLLLRRDFLDGVGDALGSLATEIEGIVAIVGFPEAIRGAEAVDPAIDPIPPPAYNSVAVLAEGAVRGVYRKNHLPNYGVFDERRYFAAGDRAALVGIDGILVGLTICEDLWIPGSPETEEAAVGATLIVNSSASPFSRGKGGARERMLARRARQAGTAVAFCNTVGGQDELVFDGRSPILSSTGELLARGPAFTPGLVLCDLSLPVAGEESGAAIGSGVDLIGSFETDPQDRVGSPPSTPIEPPHGDEEVYEALTLGLRDYTEKNGFERVVIALSGGIDSALVALLAVDALGPERVVCVSMPSPYSSEDTRADARMIATNLELEFHEVQISKAMEAYESILREPFAGTAPDVTEENLQARIRGNVVMALSNKFGWLVLTTGNKSEMSVGYATLYGDMAGGFAVIKDVLKTQVYRLVELRNARAGSPLVPGSVLERAPSAELRHDQRDEDSLPDYELLDRIIEGYVERDRGRDELIASGLPTAIVDDVIALIDRAEYKRRQAPPGVRISIKAFGRDRRLPITNRYRGARAIPARGGGPRSSS